MFMNSWGKFLAFEKQRNFGNIKISRLSRLNQAINCQESNSNVPRFPSLDFTQMQSHTAIDRLQGLLSLSVEVYSLKLTVV